MGEKLKLLEVKRWYFMEQRKDYGKAIDYAIKCIYLVERLEDILVMAHNYIEPCEECGGAGHLGRHTNGKLISCETCGGHEDAIGKGFALNDIRGLAKEIRQQLKEEW